jgi:hypothetical protein
MMRRIVLIAVIVLTTAAVAQQNASLYRASLVQAAPGKFTDLIALYKQNVQSPLWMRHSQGDRWDLLILTPLAGYDAINRIRDAERSWESQRKPLVMWEEDVFVYGPPAAELRKAFAESGFFHVEMFRALPGQMSGLVKEREMENAYLRAVKLPEGFIFLRDQGASWDVFTIGCFRDLKHYAQSADVPKDTAEAAAKAAGFDSAESIGPYLRRFIADHHDTLAVAIK